MRYGKWLGLLVQLDGVGDTGSFHSSSKRTITVNFAHSHQSVEQ